MTVEKLNCLLFLLSLGDNGLKWKKSLYSAEASEPISDQLPSVYQLAT